MKSVYKKFGRNWMNPEVQNTLFNMYIPRLIETILKRTFV